ncbi:hypothetical protein CVT25_005229 [Psilocybe cyanescens]|uniref:Uncharacterized protein n=1 Tax=Psilocybe cyanescens TaxID=93625 RepID=A0A409XKU1_PSICY|nr:hypothetical protein CVT25_005229 [Psilocybe cyanescens]
MITRMNEDDNEGEEGCNSMDSKDADGNSKEDMDGEGKSEGDKGEGNKGEGNKGEGDKGEGKEDEDADSRQGQQARTAGKSKGKDSR